jgi:hypothetical protein
MTAASLVANLQARGVTLEARGDKLHVRPTGLVRPDDLEALRARKAEVLALVRPSSRTWMNLAPAAVRDALGADPDDHDVAILRLDLLATIRRLEVEIATGVLGATPMVVRGRVLADWLDLADVARLLRLWEDRPST